MSQQHVLIAVSHYHCRSRRIPVESVSGRWQRNDVAHPAANAAFIFARADFVNMRRNVQRLACCDWLDTQPANYKPKKLIQKVKSIPTERKDIL